MLYTALPYYPDSAAHFAALAGQPWAVFLDSAWPGAAQGRYDILAADPLLTLRCWGEHTEIRSRHGVSHSLADPLSLLRDALHPLTAPHPDLPFSGGAIGYFGYDLARRFERLPSLAADVEQIPDLAVGIYDWALVVDHHRQRSHLIGQGRDPRTAPRWPALVQRFQQPQAAPPASSFRVQAPPQSNLDRAAYAAGFQRIQAYIQAGDCYQVNYAQRFATTAVGDPWPLYLRLREVNPAPFSAYLHLPDGWVLSASPERFLRVQGRQVETRPIKGTRPRRAEAEADLREINDLRQHPKDRAENLMIVDLLRNDLSKHCALGTVRVPSLFALESYATVHHLVSTVCGELAAGQDALDLLRGCFPGGSITGAPKLRAMQIIEELEPQRRGLYCGAIGYAGFDGGLDTNIAIRSLVYGQNRLRFWAGGGIVADSVLAAEYQESFDKAAALFKVLQAFYAPGSNYPNL